MKKNTSQVFIPEKKFIKRPTAMFGGILLFISLMGAGFAYPAWEGHETRNRIRAFISTKYPDKEIEQADRLAWVIYKQAQLLNFSKTTDGKKFDKVGLLMGVINTESQFTRTAKSRVGARGYMQVMPATAALIAKRRLSDKELTETGMNISLGVKFLNAMFIDMKSVEKALLAYNAGPGAVRKWGGVPKYYADVKKSHDAFMTDQKYAFRNREFLTSLNSSR